MTQSFTSFEALSAFYREQIEAPGFDAAFAEQGSLAQLSIHDEPVATEMPDPTSARAAMEMIIGTVFDLFRETRMAEFSQDIVWGVVNSFHVTTQRIASREDDASKKLGDLARSFDPSEIYAVELEEIWSLCRQKPAVFGRFVSVRVRSAPVGSPRGMESSTGKARWRIKTGKRSRRQRIGSNSARRRSRR